jgi:WD repeat-containing protein 42A
MNIAFEVLKRERCSYSTYNPKDFQRAIFGNKSIVEKFSLKNVLSGHKGCVNSVLFSEDGSLVFTGSDDRYVNIYNSETGEMLDSFITVHKDNIFYAKDLPSSPNLMITCSADGRVIITDLNNGASTKIYKHRGRAHRIALDPHSPHQFYSCGEDGMCCLFDIRINTEHSLPHEHFTPYGKDGTIIVKTSFVDVKDKKCSIYTVGVNPSKEYEIAIGGCNSHISLYDSRYFVKPFAFLCPTHLATSSANVTGLKYNYSGNFIIV